MKFNISYRLSAALLIALVLMSSAHADAKAPNHPKLDNALNSVAESFDVGGIPAADRTASERGAKPRKGGLATVIIEAPSIEDAETALNAMNITVEATSASYLRALVPYGQLKQVADNPAVSLARVATPAVELGIGLGSNLSESVALTGADALQLAGDVGTGASVAVVDLGFMYLGSAQASGDIPTPVYAHDFTGTGLETGTPHGTGVAEHVMDMAPGATLYLLKVGDEVDLQNAAATCAANDIQIANHSVGWVNASYYDGTGPINSIINDSRTTGGTFWTVAAGNDAQRHWRGGWVDADGDGLLEFNGSDEEMDLTSASSTVTLFLNWNQYGNSVTDLDLYVLNKRNRVVASSTGPQTGTQSPAEALSFSYSSRFAPYRIQVQLYSGPTDNLDITIFSFYNDLEHAVPQYSMMDPANAPGAFSVGAVDQADWTLYPPPPEPFSSQGPTNDGRPKPDIVAPDGTTCLIYGVESSYGTSFSSPTTAGAAALLLGQDLARTADDLDDLLVASAEDVGDSGWDAVYGYGKLTLLSGPPNNPPVAVDDIAAPIAEDTVATIYPLGNDSDPDGDALSIVAVGSSTDGVAAIASDALSLTFTPNADFNGDVSFTYTVSDGRGGSGTATVSLTITPVNDAPVIDDQTIETDLDTPVAIDVTASDVDGDAIAYNLSAAPVNGTLSGTLPNVTYTPNAGFVGGDSFSVVASDPAGAQDVATIQITVSEPFVATPISVAEIAVTIEIKNAFVTPTAQVVVVDADGQPISDATVSGSFSLDGAEKGTDSATTNASGVATLSIRKFKASTGQTVAFTVTGVAKTDCQYDPAANVETTDSIVVP